jgi:tRNA A-37 threonylcarbamoyl transferase component Bud32
VYHFDYGGRDYFHKSFLHRNRLEPIKGFFRGTRAERAFRGHQLLRENGLDAPQVVVVGKKGRQSFLVSEAIRDGRGLGRYFRETFVPPLSKEAIENKRLAVQTLGHQVGRLHALGIFHGDLRWGNIMAKASTPMGVEFLFLDNERTVQYRRLPYLKRLKNLVQLNMDSSPVVTGTDRMRFFLAYLLKNPELEDEKKLLIRCILEKTAARLARKSLQAAAPP